MRPTGRLHLGHYRGVLMNWTRLQHEYECYFFVADWHALTTHYDEREVISDTVLDMVIDWLACGIDPADARLFIQSRIPEHAELHLLLSMVTPLGWLERVPSYKDQRERMSDRDLDTYGFLGYPVLQSADILIYRAGLVPVGEDQAAHVEVTREIARRFNYIFGREPDFEERVEAARRKMGKRNARLYRDLRRRFQEKGDEEALATARALLETQQNISIGDRERLMGNLDGGGRAILPEPQVLLTPASRMPGVDGQKMSKSYGNTIELREEPDEIASKLRRMPTDPARCEGPIRATRRSVRSSGCTRSTPARSVSSGYRRGAGAPASDASIASSPSSTRCSRSSSRSGGGPSSTLPSPTWCGPSSRRGVRRLAKPPARRWRRSAARWASTIDNGR